jgi:hypothetical protein
MNTIPITKTTLRKLGITLFNLSIWIEKDAKFAHPNAKIQDLREMLRDVRQALGTEISEAEKDDLSGEIPSDGGLDRENDDNRDLSSGAEDEKS